jgi:hypothetical protein
MVVFVSWVVKQGFFTTKNTKVTKRTDGNGFASCDIGSVELTISLYLPVIRR